LAEGRITDLSSPIGCKWIRPLASWLVGPTRVIAPILDWFTVFAQLNCVPNIQTHRPRYVRHLSQQAASMLCMRC